MSILWTWFKPKYQHDKGRKINGVCREENRREKREDNKTEERIENTKTPHAVGRGKHISVQYQYTWSWVKGYAGKSKDAQSERTMREGYKKEKGENKRNHRVNRNKNLHKWLVWLMQRSAIKHASVSYS